MHFFVSAFVLLVTAAIGGEARIKNVDEFIEFKDKVNSGKNYSGTTVFLESDLSLAGKTFESIEDFSGVFDGQGHVISNLEMTSTSQFVGLFGSSSGIIIKNVVLDSSCSITSSYSGSDYNAYIGGIIGYCSASNGLCTIENSVNMGSVTFNGDVSSNYGSLYFGGIAGELYSYDYDIVLKNCVNYGDFTHSGTNRYDSYIGGIVGYSYGSSSSNNRVYIYNCINHGTITHSGTTPNDLYLGGIAGYIDYTTIENCVSSGNISLVKTARYNYIGSILGKVDFDAFVNYIYFTSELSGYNKYGYQSYSPSESNTLSYNASFELNETASVGNYTGTSLIDALNGYSDYYTLRDYSRWLLNKENNSMSFTINGRTSPIKMDHQIILLPSLASEGKLCFDGWYTDEGLTTPLTAFDVTSETEFYGRFEENTNNYTISFDTRREGVSVAPITAPFGSVVQLPSEVEREHCIIRFWETNLGYKVDFNFNMPSHNINLYSVWECTHIRTPEDFIDISKVVNNGVDSFNGTTVFLDSDIDFTGKSFDPIGTSSKCFLGVFDGQGHVISNLEITSFLYQYVGLFGYSTGLAIKNVIFDPSCSITSSYSSSGYEDSIFVGGIIGKCEPVYGACTIENSVNMGSVTFSGDISDFDLYIGGIAGYLFSSFRYYDSIVKNCANYGDLTHSGESSWQYIGGIVGYSEGSSESKRVYIYNCLNHGTITHNGTTSSTLYLGGISGYLDCTTIENCVSGGKITMPTTGSSDNYIGSIAGYVYFDTIINYCYFTSDLSCYGGGRTPLSESNIFSYDSTTFELNGTASIGSYTSTSLIDVLNAAAGYYTLRDYSHWLLNEENNTVSFTINGKSTFAMNTQVILLPSLASEGNMNFWWYTDEGLTTLLTELEVTIETELYGKFGENTNNYTISFDTRREGVSVAPITAPFGTAIQLPSGFKDNDGCIFSLWETKYGFKADFDFSIPSHNITLYAVWKCIHIKTPEDLIDFSKAVNNGADSFNGTIVFLDSDLSLAGKSFEPIGTSSNYFRGVFDGQGHVISNLAMTSSSSQYAGLFGYSIGLTIKNVILDSSCSIISTYKSDSGSAYIGGIIGRCEGTNGACTIKNSVNMGSAILTGNVNYLYLGGIVGSLDSSYDYESTVKNCANYGDLSHSGISHSSYMGGIIGEFRGFSSPKRDSIYNCFNHGTITHNGTSSSNLYLGGIIGRTFSTTIENCVSGGKVSSNKIRYIGSIVGQVYSSTSINYCYFTSDLSGYGKYGEGTPSSESNTLSYDNASFELDGTVSIGGYSDTSLIDALNAAADYYVLRDYSHWLINKGNKAVTFTINGRASPIKMDYQIILLPSLASEGNMSFDGWYTDEGLTTPLTAFDVTSETELYGKFEENNNNYTISFDTRREGVSVAPITAPVGKAASLPINLKKGNCIIAFWENKYSDYIGFEFTTSSHNITLYAVWKCTHIETPEDFIDFSKIVNSRTNSFNGTTVFLDSDLSFAGKTFEPIGTDYHFYFLGTFDGQGHVISNLNMTSSSEYVGLFGYSGGLTIKNVILDSSCSITSSFSASSDACIGGIIGYCNGPCTIESSVNMGSVTFSGDIGGSYDLSLGGIAGGLSSSSRYDSTVKNCANYGDVTHSGTSDDSYIGGIAGDSYGPYGSSSFKRAYIYNCLNHGTITHNGTTSNDLYFGGIAGLIYRTIIENCVSGGKFSLLTTASGDNYVGGIVGDASSDTFISYAYFTSDLSGYGTYGSGTPSSESNTLSYDSTSFELSETVSIGSYSGTSLIDALNAAADYYTLRNYSPWLLNKENNTVSFTINGRTNPIKMNYQIILLPSLASEGKVSFNGWYTDEGLTTPLTEFEATSDTELYGKFEENTNSYTISFDTRGGTHAKPITAQFNSAVTLPDEPVRENCIVAWWETEYSDYIGLSLVMPSHNITLYAVWKCTRIETTEDFIDFSKIVNNGLDKFEGTTVFLDSDLSLAGKSFEPIGNSDYRYFSGTFDGQGHVISNLEMTSPSQHVGIFGYSRGLTIKNVILDSSCSIASSYSSYYAYIGGIIGNCDADNGPCIIENSVNMGSVTFSGNIGSDLFLGGIAGDLDSTSSSHDSTMKNCANYGDVTHSGTSDDSYIGGIAGDSYGPYGSSSSERVYIYNCFNHGTITHSGTTSTGYLYVGGIAGWTYSTIIENCVSGGKISLLTTASGNCIGRIVGSASDTAINYCYFTSDLSGYDKYDYLCYTPSEFNTFEYNISLFELNGTVSIGGYSGTFLVDALNAAVDYYTLRDYSNWLINKGNNAVTFTINRRTNPIKMNYQVILLPSLASEGNMSFDGWYIDEGLTTPLTVFEFTSETELYGKYCGPNFIVTLDVNGGDELNESSKEVPFNCVYGSLPEPTRTGYKFVGWFTEKDGGAKVTNETIVSIPNNHTLIALWTANNYIVTFNPSGGSISQSTKIVTFGDAYGDLPTPNMTGHTFLGWFNERNVSVTSNSVVAIPNNHTLTAQWKAIPTSQVEIVFGTKDLTDEKIKEIVRQYTDAKFTIIRVENDNTGDITVIVQFTDIGEAEEFVRKVNTSERKEEDKIKRIGFTSESYFTGFASSLSHPFTLLSIILSI